MTNRKKSQLESPVKKLDRERMVRALELFVKSCLNIVNKREEKWRNKLILESKTNW
jgi:hypothetical protein